MVTEMFLKKKLLIYTQRVGKHNTIYKLGRQAKYNFNTILLYSTGTSVYDQPIYDLLTNQKKMTVNYIELFKAIFWQKNLRKIIHCMKL